MAGDDHDKGHTHDEDADGQAIEAWFEHVIYLDIHPGIAAARGCFSQETIEEGDKPAPSSRQEIVKWSIPIWLSSS
jgi:hypothetical protein